MVAGAFLSSAYFDLAWLFFALTAILAREVRPVPKQRYSLTPGVGGKDTSGTAAVPPQGTPATTRQAGIARSSL